MYRYVDSPINPLRYRTHIRLSIFHLQFLFMKKEKDDKKSIPVVEAKMLNIFNRGLSHIYKVITIGFGHYPSSSIISQLQSGIYKCREFPAKRCVATTTTTYCSGL